MDELDEAIVDLLESEGRLPHSEIARILGIPRASAATRVRRMTESGRVVVRGVVHPALLGRDHMAHIGVETNGRTAPTAARIAERDDASLVSVTAGRYAIAVEIRAGSIADIDRAVGELRALDAVRGVDTVTYTEVVRDVIGPIGDVRHTVDAVDLTLLRALQDDGRASYVVLARQVRLTPAGVRRRVRRLLDAQVIRVGALTRQSGRDRQAMLGLGMRLDGPHEPVVAALLLRPAVMFLARTLGRFDLVITLRAHATEELASVLDDVRALPGVGAVDSWAHLHVVKESYASPRLGAPQVGSAIPRLSPGDKPLDEVWSHGL